MSATATSHVKHLIQAPNGEKLNPSEKLVLGLLADDHNEDKGVAWPSVGNLATRACMSRENCRRILRKLEVMGLIEANPRLRENGGRSSSEYRFCLIDPPFDAKAAAVTEKRMRLQEMRAAARPVQLKMPPLHTGVEGGTTPMWGGPPHPGGGYPHTHVGGASTPVRGEELLTESLFNSKNLNPPYPPQGRGGMVADLQASGSQSPALPGKSKSFREEYGSDHPLKLLQDAVAKVMRECSLSEPRLERVIERTIRTEASRTDEVPNWNEIAERMIKAYLRHGELGRMGMLRHTPVRARRFFGEGIWRDEGRWGIDEERFRQANRF